jgi:multimeric flavodoxin WrbA
MKVTILNGARENDHRTGAVNELALQELARLSCETQSFSLRDAKIAYCQGDFECWIKTPGMCKADDDSRDIARAIINSDLVIYVTPITFGGYSSELKRALDKMICLIAPFFQTINGEIHHQKRYARYPRLLGIGTLAHRDEECERIFTTLVARNAINIHAPAHNTRVIFDDQSADAIRADLRAALTQIGGTK